MQTDEQLKKLKKEKLTRQKTMVSFASTHITPSLMCIERCMFAFSKVTKKKEIDSHASVQADLGKRKVRPYHNICRADPWRAHDGIACLYRLPSRWSLQRLEAWWCRLMKRGTGKNDQNWNERIQKSRTQWSCLRGWKPQATGCNKVFFALMQFIRSLIYPYPPPIRWQTPQQYTYIM